MPKHIISLDVANVKILKAVHITPDGNLVVIGGNNENGKTSVLDSIAMILGGLSEAPPVPIRIGEGKATIIADFGDMIVKRTFTFGGGSSLTITNKDGSKASSPQAIMDKLTGKVTFDPLGFINMDPKAQADAIKKIVGLDFTKLDADRKATYDLRTTRNAEVKRIEAAVDSMPHYADAAKESVSTEALMADLKVIQTHNAQKSALIRARDDAGTALSTVNNSVNCLEAEILELDRQLKENRANLERTKTNQTVAIQKCNEAKTALDAFVSKDETPITDKISGAGAANAKVSANAARAAQQALLPSARQAAADLSNKIDAIDAQKAAALANAKFPVAGLSFDENGVTFDKLPFSQASAAKKMRVSVAIAAALNPKLRVMLVRDGSLLDQKSLALLGELAKEHDLQVWVERVGKGKECSVIIEDGSVEAQGSAPAATPIPDSAFDESSL